MKGNSVSFVTPVESRRYVLVEIISVGANSNVLALFTGVCRQTVGMTYEAPHSTHSISRRRRPPLGNCARCVTLRVSSGTTAYLKTV